MQRQQPTRFTTPRGGGGGFVERTSAGHRASPARTEARRVDNNRAGSGERAQQERALLIPESPTSPRPSEVSPTTLARQQKARASRGRNVDNGDPLPPANLQEEQLIAKMRERMEAWSSLREAKVKAEQEAKAFKKAKKETAKAAKARAAGESRLAKEATKAATKAEKEAALLEKMRERMMEAWSLKQQEEAQAAAAATGRPRRLTRKTEEGKDWSYPYIIERPCVNQSGKVDIDKAGFKALGLNLLKRCELQTAEAIQKDLPFEVSNHNGAAYDTAIQSIRSQMQRALEKLCERSGDRRLVAHQELENCAYNKFMARLERANSSLYECIRKVPNNKVSRYCRKSRTQVEECVFAQVLKFPPQSTIHNPQPTTHNPQPTTHPTILSTFSISR